jgi:hypothetical protein
LQVAVDGGTQVVHDLLADGVGEQRLRNPERAGRKRDADHPGDKPRKQLRVVVGDGVVENLSQQEG